MSGLGSSGFGSTPFGLGTPVPGSAPPSGATKLSRYINAGTGDYEVDDDTGQLKQMPGVRQRMLLALRTRKGSSATLPGLGLDLPDRIDQSFETVLRNRIRRACAQLTDVEKVSRIDDIIVSRGGAVGRIIALVVFTDLTQPGAPQAPIEVLS